MISLLLWCATACACALMLGATYNAVAAMTEWSLARLNEWHQLRELEAEVHRKALRAASSEVD